MSKLALFHPESHDVYIGQQGYLFGKDTTPTNTKTTIDALNTFSKHYKKINFSLMCVPSSQNIKDCLLPAFVPKPVQISEIRDFTSKLSDRITVLDSTTTLIEHKDEYTYYKTDHHWTTKGAKLVFESVAKDLGITIAYDNELLLVSENFQGTLASKSGYPLSKDAVFVPRTNDCPVEYLVTYLVQGEKSTSFFAKEKLQEKDVYQIFFGSNHPIIDIKTTSDINKTLLIFKDSYANCFVPFLYPYYRHIIMIDPRYYTESLSSVMKTNEIDQVLFLYSGNILLADTNLTDVLTSALPENE